MRAGSLLALVLAAACVSTAVPPPTTAGPAPSVTVASTTTVVPRTTLPPAPTTSTTRPPDPLLGLALETISEDVHRPVFVAPRPGDDRLFVVEREGRILAVEPGGEPSVFVDLRSEVGSAGIEQGLLGLAFHPGHAENGRLFVYFTDRTGDSRLVELRVPPGSDRPEGEGRLVLAVSQPGVRHNAGMLLFGPDGYLYVALGDGGAGGRIAQDPGELLGSILRLDVDGGEPYAVPPDNPFTGGGGAPEVWAYGLRNPWRFAIDPVEGLLYVADVGQADREEINVVPLGSRGVNFGWPVMEGSACFLGPDCDRAELVGPVLEYGHDEGCSVTGGFVYRGEAIPELGGHYFYSDWCGGWVRSFRHREGSVVDAADWSSDLGPVGQVNSFGLDGSGELYVATWAGEVARIVPVR